MKAKEKLRGIEDIGKDKGFKKVVKNLKKSFAEAEGWRRDFLEYLPGHCMEGEK